MKPNCDPAIGAHPLPWRVVSGLTGAYTTIVDASGNHVLGYTTADDGVHGPLADIVAIVNATEGKTLLTAEEERADKLVGLLRECEWSGTIWTDTAVCPICGAVRDGMPAHRVSGLGFQPPLTHAADCRLAEAIK